MKHHSQNALKTLRYGTAAIAMHVFVMRVLSPLSAQAQQAKKLIAAVRDVSILPFTNYIIKSYQNE